LNDRLKGFDGLRALAVLLVLVAHASSTWDYVFPQVVLKIIGNGGIGVRIFFVISGFLITFLLLKEMKKTGRIDLKSFFIRRSLRIFPAFFTYIFVIFCLSFSGVINLSNSHIISAATFTWNYGHLWLPMSSIDQTWFVGHFWTLALEEQYYLVWPALLVLLGIKKSLKMAIIIIALMPLIRVSSYFIFPENRGQLGMMFHTALDPILIGSIGALLFYNNERFPKNIINNIFCAICITFVLFISPSVEPYISGYDPVIGTTLESLSILYVILWLQTNPKSKFTKILETKWIVFIGSISFSLYLWQQLFLTNLNTSFVGYWPVNIVCAFIVAILSYFIIERPFLNIRDNMKKKKSALENSRYES
jgi:peptidoglycan/LPS O-acetylase OafA/YrhL